LTQEAVAYVEHALPVVCNSRTTMSGRVCAHKMKIRYTGNEHTT
jgi:hypothetical protein